MGGELKGPSHTKSCCQAPWYKQLLCFVWHWQQTPRCAGCGTGPGLVGLDPRGHGHVSAQGPTRLHVATRTGDVVTPQLPFTHTHRHPHRALHPFHDVNTHTHTLLWSCTHVCVPTHGDRQISTTTCLRVWRYGLRDFGLHVDIGQHKHTNTFIPHTPPSAFTGGLQVPPLGPALPGPRCPETPRARTEQEDQGPGLEIGDGEQGLSLQPPPPECLSTALPPVSPSGVVFPPQPRPWHQPLFFLSLPPSISPTRPPTSWGSSSLNCPLPGPQHSTMASTSSPPISSPPCVSSDTTWMSPSSLKTLLLLPA